MALVERLRRLGAADLVGEGRERRRADQEEKEADDDRDKVCDDADYITTADDIEGDEQNDWGQWWLVIVRGDITSGRRLGTRRRVGSHTDCHRSLTT